MDTAYLRSLRQHLTKPWEYQVLDWCETKGIYDVRPYTGDGDEWNLVWPPDVPNQKARIIRQINFVYDDIEDSLVAFSGAYASKRRAHQPLLAKYGDKTTYSKSELLETLSNLKSYAESIREEDLAPLKE